MRVRVGVKPPRADRAVLRPGGEQLCVPRTSHRAQPDTHDLVLARSYYPLTRRGAAGSRLGASPLGGRVLLGRLEGYGRGSSTPPTGAAGVLQPQERVEHPRPRVALHSEEADGAVLTARRQAAAEEGHAVDLSGADRVGARLAPALPAAHGRAQARSRAKALPGATPLLVRPQVQLA